MANNYYEILLKDRHKEIVHADHCFVGLQGQLVIALNRIVRQKWWQIGPVTTQLKILRVIAAGEWLEFTRVEPVEDQD